MSVDSLPSSAQRDGEPDVIANARIVIIDDQPANVVLLGRMLEAIGLADIHPVTDATQAVARCLEVGPDLVLLDLHMPGVDGHEVLRQLRELTPADEFLPVLVLTADTTVAARDRALRAGANDFLTKPLDHTEVVLRVRNLLETRAQYRDLQQHTATLRADLDLRTEGDRQAAREREDRTARIDAALAPDALQMVFQPIVELAGGDAVGAEALARFSCDPPRPPNLWFDEAEAVGRGGELELSAAAAALASLEQLPPVVFLSINVSPATAMLPELADLLSGYDGRRIVLELTEHARVDDYAPLLAALDRLRAAGVRVAVDDTGTGYAGLTHLLALRPELLKLDLALTRDIDTDAARRALATGLLSFADEIGATVVAEGIETASELETLRDLGIELGQGYHLARPTPLPLQETTAR